MSSKTIFIFYVVFLPAKTVQTDCNATLRPLGQRMQRARSMLRCSLFSRFSIAKLRTLFWPRNSTLLDSETVRKPCHTFRKNLRKTAAYRPFIKLKNRFTMLFLRVVSCASLVSRNVHWNSCPLGASIIFDTDDSQGSPSSCNSIER